jgi:plastocyanin
MTANDHTNPYGYAPSRKTVKSGELTVQLINVGEDEHNMDIEKVGPGGTREGPILKSISAPSKGASAPTTADVEAGTYRMWCTLPGHAAKGMETTIDVE